jgi:folate-binding protein YgfZ
MSNCYVAQLTDRAVVRVSGEAACSFLQGMITNDINKVSEEAAIHAGLLAPQGKILFDFFVLADRDSYLLDCASAQAAALIQRLNFYRLRAKVEIGEEPSLGVAAAWGDEVPKLPDGAHACPDPRLPALGFRILLPKSANVADLGCAVVTEADYHARRIALGVPEGGRDYAYGDTFPHEAMFDQLAGVDFDKGCYVGQEVVSRMQHRGTARKRVVCIEGEAALPASGTFVVAGATPIGTLGSVNGTSGLALLRLDRAEEAKGAGQPLRAGEVTVAVRIPAWARLRTPAPAAS